MRSIKTVLYLFSCSRWPVSFFFASRLYACISLSRKEWPIDLHIVDTKGSAGKPWITNEVHNTTQKARTREMGDPPLDNPSN
jgi:hypothetical protein